MGFLTDCTKARLDFAEQIKESDLNPKNLNVYCEYADDEKMAVIYADDVDGTTQAVSAFDLNPNAWNQKLQRELATLFKGSAILAKRGR